MSQIQNRAAVLARLTEIIGEQLGISIKNLTESSTAKDIPGWDSLAHVTIVLAIEKEYQFKLRTAEIGRLQNVAGLVDVILQRGKVPVP